MEDRLALKTDPDPDFHPKPALPAGLRAWTRALVLASSALLAVTSVHGQTQTQFFVKVSNLYGPGRSLPFIELSPTGCLLDSFWKMQLLVGITPDSLVPLGDSVAFRNDANGQGTGLFTGGYVAIPREFLPHVMPPEARPLLGQVVVWTGADSYEAAQATVFPAANWGRTQVFEIPIAGSDAGLLVAMSAPTIGPITGSIPPFSQWSFTGETVILKEKLIDLAWRPLGARQWSKWDFPGNRWIALAGATNSALELSAISPRDAGVYAMVWDYGCPQDSTVRSSTVTLGVMEFTGTSGLRFHAGPGTSFKVFTTQDLRPPVNWVLLHEVTMDAPAFDLKFPDSSAQRFFLADPPMTPRGIPSP